MSSQESVSAAAVKPRVDVGRAGLVMAGSLALSRVLAVVRELIIGWTFGQNMQTDAYRQAFQIPDLLFYLIAGGALSSAFIPVFSEYWHRDEKHDAWHVFSSVATIMAIAVSILIGVAMIYAPFLAHRIAPTAGPEKLAMITYMSRILLPGQFAFFIGSLLLGTLYARQLFSVPGLAPNIYNFGIIVGAVVISRFVVPGVSGMAWGAVFGAVIGNLIIPGWMMMRLGSSFRPKADLKHPGVRKFFRLMAPIVFGLSLSGVFPFIINYFGDHYRIDGLVSSLNNANQLMQAPLGIFGQSLALAVFPSLSQFFAEKRFDLYRDQVASTLRTTIYLSMPISLMMLVIPDDIVRMIFEHGKFTAIDTHRTGICLRMFAIGIVPWSLQPVLMRSFFAYQQTVLPVVIGTAATGLFGGLCFLMVKAGLGFWALPLVASVTALLLALSLMLALKTKLGGLDLIGISKTTLTSFCAALAVGAFLVASHQLVFRGGASALNGTWLTGYTLVCLVTSSWLYYLVTRWFKMPETDMAERVFRKMNPLRKNRVIAKDMQ